MPRVELPWPPGASVSCGLLRDLASSGLEEIPVARLQGPGDRVYVIVYDYAEDGRAYVTVEEYLGDALLARETYAVDLVKCGVVDG